MKIFWDNLGSHILHVKESDDWHLFCELDQNEDAVINLDLNGQVYQLCWSNEYTQGREHLGLDAYHVIEFYTAVIRSVFDRIKTSHPTYLDLTEIKNEVMPPLWQQWKDRGFVVDEHW